MNYSMLLAAACCAAFAASAEVTADFTQTTAKFRPALHSSGYAPNFDRAHQAVWDEKLKEMNFEPMTVKVKGGKFTLSKPDAYSAAFLVTFDL